MKKEAAKKPKSVTPPERSEPETAEVRANGERSGVRYASDEQFKKAQSKTSTLHAGLFRRLAK